MIVFGNLLDPVEFDKMQRSLKSRDGTGYTFYVDNDWVNGPLGRVDLFLMFNNRVAPMTLVETMVVTPVGPMVIYGVADNLVPAFDTFLEQVIFEAPDGGYVAPKVLHPPELVGYPLLHEELRLLTQRCNIITVIQTTADSPVAVQKREQIRRMRQMGLVPEEGDQ